MTSPINKIHPFVYNKEVRRYADIVKKQFEESIKSNRKPNSEECNDRYKEFIWIKQSCKYSNDLEEIKTKDRIRQELVLNWFDPNLYM